METTNHLSSHSTGIRTAPYSIRILCYSNCKYVELGSSAVFNSTFFRKIIY